MAHHGPFTWGATIDEAVRNAQRLEYIAQMAWITLQISPTMKSIHPLYIKNIFSENMEIILTMVRKLNE